MEAAEPKRRLRISLRVFLLLVFVAGAWMGSFVIKARRQREAVAAIQRIGGWVEFEQSYGNSSLTDGAMRCVARGLQRITGDDYLDVVDAAYTPLDVRDVAGNTDDLFVQLKKLTRLKLLYLWGVCETTDEGLGHIRNLTRLEHLRIVDGHRISDAGAAHLARLTNLRYLEVYGSKMTDEGLARLGTLLKLESLELSGESFTEAGLRHLGALPRLTNLSFHTGGPLTAVGMDHLQRIEGLVRLDVSRNIVTADGLMKFKKMKNLKWIGVIDSGVTEEAIKKLRESMPGVWIENG